MIEDVKPPPPRTPIEIRKLRRKRKANRPVTMAERYARKRIAAEKQYQEKLARAVSSMF